MTCFLKMSLLDDIKHSIFWCDISYLNLPHMRQYLVASWSITLRISIPPKKSEASRIMQDCLKAKASFPCRFGSPEKLSLCWTVDGTGRCPSEDGWQQWSGWSVPKPHCTPLAILLSFTVSLRQCVTAWSCLRKRGSEEPALKFCCWRVICLIVAPCTLTQSKWKAGFSELHYVLTGTLATVFNLVAKADHVVENHSNCLTRSEHGFSRFD